MEDDGPGHVFVMHGDLTKLMCDYILVPADRHGDVKRHWGRWWTTALTASDMADRVSLPQEADDQIVWYVDSGALPQTASASWLRDGVRAGLAAVVDYFQRTAKRALCGRQRPIIGMPLFGTGDGGFAGVRGAALRAVLDATGIATEAGLDVVIVCYERSDYSALQSKRSEAVLKASVRPDAFASSERLGALARNGGLALFFGAGVSSGAGLPDWKELLREIAVETGHTEAVGTLIESNGLLEAATVLEDALGEDFEMYVASALHRHRHGVCHGLLASLRVPEAITTNFEALYELAARVPMPKLVVLPWKREPGQAPWLLKLHGDLGRSGLVFTNEQFEAFSEERSVVAAVLKGLLVTRHVLFLGYSMNDPDVLDIVADIAKTLDAADAPHTGLGTFLSLTPTQFREIGSKHNVTPVLVGDDDDAFTSHDTRALEIFLDLVGWEAAKHEASWVLDGSYDEMLDDASRQLAAELKRLVIPDGPDWENLRVTLDGYGLGRKRSAREPDKHVE